LYDDVEAMNVTLNQLANSNTSGAGLVERIIAVDAALRRQIDIEVDDLTSLVEEQVVEIWTDLQATNNTVNRIAPVVDGLTVLVEQQVGGLYADLEAMNKTINQLLATIARINKQCLLPGSGKLGAGPDVCGGSSPASSDNTGVIVAAVLGTVFGVGVSAIVCLFFTRRKKHQALLDEHLLQLQTPLMGSSSGQPLGEL